ncbi:MAG: hypothetical protein BWK73_46745 [Thiothrix lacustris]|uniref:Uncharacterized protein n=1 Tax=Thiothrix lacustris TaxID=525917 RepID=A0A1Y1QA38_9GAMM|nr:MAG: hypothetical protein BWK73_46745 [Thiothrix lacustris]
MKNILLAVMLPLLVVACTTTPEKTALQQGISTKGAAKVAFHNVRITTNPNGTNQLQGNLQRIGRDPVHFGHLDYAVTDLNGKMLEAGQANYSGAIKRRQPRTPSRFSIPLKQAWQPEQHRATVVWANDTHQQ